MAAWEAAVWKTENGFFMNFSSMEFWDFIVPKEITQ